MPILKYNPTTVYNPKSFKNEVRRATKSTIERRFKYIPLRSKAAMLLLYIPGVKQLLQFSMKQAVKLLKLEAQVRYKLLETSKEE